MSKLSYYFLLSSFLFFSCQNKSEINQEFNCKTDLFNNLEVIGDMKSLFSVEIPKNWKTNLYHDEVQSSIFTADTTKQLTETVLLDVTFIQNKINFDDEFILQQEQEHLSKNLVKIKSKAFQLLDKPSFYMLFRGKKGKFKYQVCNTFIKVNESNFILAKSEIYGDSLVNSRLCKSFTLIDKIKLNH